MPRSIQVGALLLLLLASGCREGPDSETLKSEIQLKLDQEFQQGLLKVAYMTRNGSSPYSEKGDDTPRRIVYYKARLEFLSAYDFSKWEQLNEAALASVLGAQPAGVSGIKPGGNEAGSLLEVFGTSTYVKQDGEWVPSGTLGPPQEAVERVEGLDELPQLERDLAALSTRLTKIRNKNMEAHLRVLEEELARAKRNIGLRLDELEGTLTLVSGAPMGEYHALGEGLALLARSKDLPLANYSSSGSVENLHLVAAGSASFAIVQNDMAWTANHATDLFAGGPPLDELRAVGSLFPEAIHVVVSRTSGLTDLTDFRGKRVNLGPHGSGTRVNAVHLLQAHGVAEADLATTGALPLDQAARALAAGEFDALFTTSAFPTRPLERLATQEELGFLSPSEEAIRQLRKSSPALRPLVIPANTYQGQAKSVATLGVTALVVTHASSKDAAVNSLLKLLFLQPAELAKASASPFVSLISRERGRVGVSIPLHPAAEAFLPQE